MRKYKIEGGLFFPEDFQKLPKGAVIFIKEGLILDAKKKAKKKTKG